MICVQEENLVTFDRPKHLQLQEPGLTAEVQEATDGAFTVTIDAKQPALWVWPDLSGIKASYSKRFFHLFPGKPIEVYIQPKHVMSLAEFKEKLQLSSLTDTFK